MANDWTPEQRRNLRSWGHKFKEDRVEPRSKNPTTREEAARIWAFVLRWMGKGGRKPNVIPEEFFKEVVRK